MLRDVKNNKKIRVHLPGFVLLLKLATKLQKKYIAIGLCLGKVKLYAYFQ